MLFRNFSLADNKFKILYYTVSFSFLLISKLLRKISLVTILLFVLFSILLLFLQLKSSRETYKSVGSTNLVSDDSFSKRTSQRSSIRYQKYKNLLLPIGIFLGVIFSYLSFRFFSTIIHYSGSSVAEAIRDALSFKGIMITLPGIVFPLQWYEIASFIIGLIIIFICFYFLKFKRVINIGIGYGLGSAFNFVLLDPENNDFIFTVVFTTLLLYSICLLLEPKRKWVLILMPIYAFIILGFIYWLPNVLFKNEMKNFFVQENTFEINSLGITSIYYPFPYKLTPFLRVDVINNIIPPKKVVYNILKQEPNHFEIDVKLATIPVEFKYHAEGVRKPPD